MSLAREVYGSPGGQATVLCDAEVIQKDNLFSCSNYKEDDYNILAKIPFQNCHDIERCADKSCGC